MVRKIIADNYVFRDERAAISNPTKSVFIICYSLCLQMVIENVQIVLIFSRKVRDRLNSIKSIKMAHIITELLY